MVEINVPDRHVDSSRLFDEDRIVNIKRRLFFTHDLAQSRRFIVDQTDAT